MATRVSRHAFPADSATAEGNVARVQSLARILGRLEESEMSRSRALGSALTVAKQYCAADPEASNLETWEAWVTAMQVGCALFDSATAAEGPVPCRIGSQGEVRNLPATGATSYTHAGAWLTSVYLATVCRENERLDRLMQVPVSFLRASGAEIEEYVYGWVEALQNFWNGRAAETWAKLIDAINGTDVETVPVFNRELTLKIMYPPVELFQLLNRGETEQFNTSLAGFLAWHKQYWTGSEARSLDSEGLVALSLLAIVCMAYDNDVPIEVESEYLPKHLLKRSWVGECDA
ncbi:immunity 49 family protein [Streptomyces gamaensis]|uniref:Immunity 49 family protein n=1 Tax=Streptomyces gamaensis TaxID=1763542 RepID=A0ABW0YZ22_9ACTN